MDTLSYTSVTSGEVYSLESTGLGYPLLTLLLCAAVPLVCALALFLCLRRADIHTRLTVFFAGCAVYIAADVFAFSDFRNVIGMFAETDCCPCCGFICTLAAGVVLTGFCILMCSAGIMRGWGRIPVFVFTVVFSLIQAYMLYTVLPYDTTPSVGSIFPFAASLPPAIADAGADIAAAAIYAVFALLCFICFASNRTPAQIAEKEKEYQIKVNRRRHGTAGTEKDETRCATCQYSRLLKTDTEHVICDTNGIVDSNHICPYFLYDPVKRIPERPPCPYGSMTADADDGKAPQASAAPSADITAESGTGSATERQAAAAGQSGISAIFDKLSRKNQSASVNTDGEDDK